MNEEQLKQLKPGDTVFIRATFKKILDDGDVLFLHTQTSLDDEVEKTEEYTLPDNVMLPPSAPKYDPCRRFKKGDRVRVVEWSGRNPVLPFMDCKVGDIGTVIKDEETTSFFVRLHLEGKYEKDMPYCHLELVTPVEELSPYSVHESEVLQGFDIVREKMCVMSFPFGAKECGWYYNRLEAKEAAEAECARLNAAYRKEEK